MVHDEQLVKDQGTNRDDTTAESSEPEKNATTVPAPVATTSHLAGCDLASAPSAGPEATLPVPANLLPVHQQLHTVPEPSQEVSTQGSCGDSGSPSTQKQQVLSPNLVRVRSPAMGASCIYHLLVEPIAIVI